MSSSIWVLQQTHCHLNKAGNIVRIMVFDFLRAFKMIQPAVLREELQKTQVDAFTIDWTFDYLTNRP